MKTLFGVYEHTDKTEGRGPERLVALFENEDEAKEANKEVVGVMGSDNSCGIRRMPCFATAAEWKIHTSQESLRKAALSKLTDKEKRLLGLA